MAETSGRPSTDLGLDMDVESPKGSRRINARLDGHVDPQTRSRGFRIEDETGRVLRKIHGARTPQEAVALYWRVVGAAMPEAMMGKDLDRRISRARAMASRGAMQTQELPFEPIPPGDETEAAEEGSPASFPVRRGRLRKTSAPVPQIDLFGGDETAAAPSTDAPPAEVQPAPSPEARPEPRFLDVETIMLQRVDPRNLRSTDRADGYLYHVTNSPDAETALRQGLAVNPFDPMILTERQGVAYWLSVVAEDYDYIMDGPADFVVLRMRRLAVDELLEPDAHASRSAGCPCYLLTGGAASREQSEASMRDR
jgi:hypothetical protein